MDLLELAQSIACLASPTITTVPGTMLELVELAQPDGVVSKSDYLDIATTADFTFRHSRSWRVADGRCAPHG